ncbi:MAG: hypothetical protein IJK89_00795 [Clostridia bacterium]|nr:hypothetical protein [Clostridia bacterium]
MKKFFAVVLALTMVLALAACGGKTEPASTQTDAVETTAAEDAGKVSVMTHDEYVAADLDTAVCVETYVQAKQSWWEDKATVYCQGPDGAYFVYNMTCSEEDYAKLTQGTKIQIQGYKTEWSGEVEIAEGATFTILEGEEPYIAEPIDVTELLGTDELIDHQNELVKFTGMTVEAKKDADGNDVAFLYKWDGSGAEGDDLYFDVSYNGQTYTFTVESYLTGLGTNVYDQVREMKIGDTVDLEGFLYWYEGVNPHITAMLLG